MNVLVACEESQRVCMAFRRLGHNAYSCDLLPCSGGHPEYHIQNDCIKILYSKYFVTQNLICHCIDNWDLVIAHPPCTRLCNSGQRWLYTNDSKYNEKKLEEQTEAIWFFMKFVNFALEFPGVKVAIENPVGIMSSVYRKPDCIYNPYDFNGETECKRTCLWLFNLSPLVPTQILPVSERTHNIWKSRFNGKSIPFNSPECARLRSQTPLGVAEAMASQWGGPLAHYT